MSGAQQHQGTEQLQKYGSAGWSVGNPSGLVNWHFLKFLHEDWETGALSSGVGWNTQESLEFSQAGALRGTRVILGTQPWAMLVFAQVSTGQGSQA